MGTLLFTRNLLLALIVLLDVIATIICLFFFMVAVMGWAIGAIEVFSLIVFVGIAVDYCLHVAHKYHSCHIAEAEERQSTHRPSGARRHGKDVSVRLCDNPLRRSQNSSYPPAMSHRDERFERTKYAMGRVGSAVMGSGLTTFGCSAFLLPCELLVFMKIGTIVCAVTFFALLHTLVLLPAMLMTVGPSGHESRRCRQAVWWAARLLQSNPKEDEERSRASQARTMGAEGKSMPGPGQRYYVLNLPRRGMGQCGVGHAVSRTKVVITG